MPLDRVRMRPRYLYFAWSTVGGEQPSERYKKRGKQRRVDRVGAGGREAERESHHRFESACSWRPCTV